MYLRRLYSTGAISTLSRVDTTQDGVLRPVPSHPIMPDPSIKFWQEVKKYWKVVLFCLGLMFGSLVGGYDTAISGNIIAVPRFQQDFGVFYDNAYIIPSVWLSCWNAATAIGIMGGSLAGGWLEDRYGRRMSLLTGSFNSAIALILNYVPYLLDNIDSRRGTYLVGRILQGFALGVIGSTSQTFMSEISPPSLQGSMMALLPFGELLGELLGGAIVLGCVNDDSNRAYLNPIASQWAFLVIPIVVVITIPESPAWLIRVKRTASLTQTSLKRLHTVKVDLQSIQDDLEAVILHGNGEYDDSEVRYIDCFRGTDRRRTWIVVFTSALPVIFGLPLLAQASYFAQNYGMDPDLSLLLLIIGIIVGLIANGAGIFILSKVGRRKLILTSITISIFLWMGMGIAGCFNGGPVTIWWSATSMILVVLVNGLGAWPASYAVSSETSALRLRARSQGIGWFAYSLASGVMSFVLPYIYNPDSGDLRAKTGFVLSGSCIFGLVVAWFLVPEMMDRSIVEIDQMFQLKLPTRAFKNWTPEDGFADALEDHKVAPVTSRVEARTPMKTPAAIPEEPVKEESSTGYFVPHHNSNV